MKIFGLWDVEMSAVEQLQELFRTIDEDETAPAFDLARYEYSEAVQHLPDFSDLLTIWDAKRGDHRLPDWKDFDFTDFRGLHADIVLSSFENDNYEPFFRLSGEIFGGVVDHNVKGLFFSECWPRLFSMQFREHFKEIKEKGLIDFAEGFHATRDRSHIPIRVIELPVRDGGEDVCRMIHLVKADIGVDTDC